ncbi:MAG TPA: response regulator, partial [Polyangiaceae bacterium]|nr:response regulator [Polyangiaceae bacterium]
PAPPPGGAQPQPGQPAATATGIPGLHPGFQPPPGWQPPAGWQPPPGIPWPVQDAGAAPQ